jgi:hypothetical protein
MNGAKDPAPLARAVVLWLYIWLIGQSVEAATSILQIFYLSPLDPSTPLTASDSIGGPIADMIVGLAAIGWMLVYLVTGFLVLKWIYRVNSNAQLLGEGMSVTPGWNVGFFFVPIMTWFRPYQGVRESWQVSHDPENWPLVEVPALLPWWWGCWVVSSILGYVSMRLSFASSTAGETLVSLWLDVASGILGIPLGLLLIRIVRQLTRAQVRALDASAFA